MSQPKRILIGLVGANIGKSLSPALQEDALTAAGLGGYYHLMDVNRLANAGLDNILASVRRIGFGGINVTFPFKQAIIPLLDEVAPEARQIGAVNTVRISESGSAIGYNTDRIGFLRSFEDDLGRAAVDGRPALLVGAGGAGRAVAIALIDLGASVVFIHDKDANQASRLVADIMLHCGIGRARLVEDVILAATDVSGIVNATPIGMSGMPGIPVSEAAIKQAHWVADVIYSPIETAFIRNARAKGCRVLTGGGMCVHQAAESFRIFTDLQPDTERMHRTFAAALAIRDADLTRAA